MVEIHLSVRWVDHEDSPHLLLVSELLQDYLSVRQHIQTKMVTVGVAQDLDEQGVSVEWKRIDLRIPRFQDWREFSQWCSNLGISVIARKKVIDGNKDWWPVSIEVDAPSDNELIFAAKLRML